MKRGRLFSAPVSSFLLVQPLHTEWLDGSGQPLSEPPPTDQPVRVVADLIEETHVQLEVPALMGSDRSGFIQVQTQSLLPDVALLATWQSAASQPILAKAFKLNAVGVSSHGLQDALDQALAQHRPIQGVWPLSYLMAQWASQQKNLPRQGPLLLCLGMAHGLRMVLLNGGVPVFSRLLVDTNPEQQATELVLTLKYLSDNRILERAAVPDVVLMQPTTGLAQALQAQGIQARAPGASPSGQGVWADVLALATGKTPGQLAPPALRRYFLATQARQAVVLTTVVLALGGLWSVAGQAMGVLAQREQTQQWQQQAQAMTQSAQVIQRGIAASGVDTRLMRLAIEVKERELQSDIDLPPAMLQLAQLMQAQPQADLVRTEWALVPSACGGAQPLARPGAPPAPPAPPVPPPLAATPGAAATQVEWQFELRPAAHLSPSARQQLLDGVSRTVRAWPTWQVRMDPVQAASAAVIASGQTGSGSGAEWRWCLSPQPTQAPMPTPTPGQPL